MSVSSNIAERQGRLIRSEFLHFLGLARGSLLELETQPSIALKLGHLHEEALVKLDQESYQVLGLINRLLDSLRKPEVVASPAKLVEPLETLATLKL